MDGAQGCTGYSAQFCENESMRYIAILALILAILLPGSMPAQYYPRRGPVAATATSGPYGGPAVTFNGTVKALTKKELIVDLDPGDSGAQRQSLTFRLSKKTKFLKADQPIKPSDIETGTHISIDATRDGDLKFSALNVMLVPPGKAAGSAAGNPDDKPAAK
jgi:hypothetical protein